MRTRSSSNLVGESSLTPTTTKHRNRRRSKQPFILEESPVDTIADQRTMTKLLRAPTEGAARRWLEKEPPRSILTWEDLVSKFINEFFPTSRMTNLQNEISNFPQWLDDSFHEAWDRYKDLLRACTHHGFIELHQLDTLYNALNPSDEDSLNSAVGGNILERRTQDALTIIENKSKCLAADGNTFPEIQDNIQGYVSAATVNYNQGNSGYRPPSVANQIRPLDTSYQAPSQQNQVVPLSKLEKIKKTNEINIKAMQTQINNVKNELRNEMKTSIQASMSNQTNELKNMMASVFQMNTAFTLGSRPLPNNTICNPKGELKSITTRSGLVLDGPFVPMPPSFINLEEDEHAEETLTDPKLAVILKKLPEKLGDPGKFLILCGFSEFKCKALADLGASINLMALLVWKKLGLPELISTRMTLELANQAICTPTGITRDVFVLIGKFTFLVDFVIIDYESNPRVLLILEPTNMINIYNDSYEDYLKDLFATNHLSGNPTFSSHTDLTSPKVINPLSGNTTSSSPDHLLEVFADELALITFPQGNDNLPFHIESDLRKIEYLLNHDPTKEIDSILEDSIYECNLADLNNDLDDLVELEFDNDDVYDDPFESKENKIKESKLLIDELDSPRLSDFLPSPEYDSVLYEDFFKVDALPSTNNKDKVFNMGILIHENLDEVTNRVTPDKNVKKISISNASLILEDFNPPLYELPFHKEVLGSETLLSFSSKNKEKVFNPGILTSKGVHTFLLSKLSHRGLKAFKVIKIFESPIEIFPCSYGGILYFGCFVSPFLFPMNNSSLGSGQAE
uniref:Reverse transcriptase domain-containing protein n=1 Tax=Tanacetum cinerariifolium TaxID=118510 RepID=A0A6L2PAY1_TANCI|nr:reverse transcriptase domain-containing protein [Tanacetum cinerariifolium]